MDIAAKATEDKKPELSILYEGIGFVLASDYLEAVGKTHFSEIQNLAKKDENGNIVGIWGAMSDSSRSFLPWEKKEECCWREEQGNGRIERDAFVVLLFLAGYKV